MYCDGAARGNPGPAGIGVVVMGPGGRVLTRVGEGIGIATNNVAEYRAALKGLAVAREAGAARVVLRSDSRLLIEQLAGRFRVKNPTLMRLHGEARRLLSAFREVRLEHVPRELNVRADRLANEGVDRWLADTGGRYRGPEPTPRLFEATGPATSSAPRSDAGAHRPILEDRRSRPGGRSRQAPAEESPDSTGQGAG